MEENLIKNRTELWYLKQVYNLEKETREFSLGEKVWIIKRELIDYFELMEYWYPGIIVGYNELETPVEGVDIYLVYSHNEKQVTEHYDNVLFKEQELPANVQCSTDHEYTRDWEYYYRTVWSTPRK